MSLTQLFEATIPSGGDGPRTGYHVRVVAVEDFARQTTDIVVEYVNNLDVFNNPAWTRAERGSIPWNLAMEECARSYAGLRSRSAEMDIGEKLEDLLSAINGKNAELHIRVLESEAAIYVVSVTDLNGRKISQASGEYVDQELAFVSRECKNYGLQDAPEEDERTTCERLRAELDLLQETPGFKTD